MEKVPLLKDCEDNEDSNEFDAAGLYDDGPHDEEPPFRPPRSFSCVRAQAEVNTPSSQV